MADEKNNQSGSSQETHSADQGYGDFESTSSWDFGHSDDE